MPYSYLRATEGEFTFREDTQPHPSEGYVVFDVETNEAKGVFPTEEDAKEACAVLNREENA